MANITIDGVPLYVNHYELKENRELIKEKNLDNEGYNTY